jgi:hypothetical protein
MGTLTFVGWYTKEAVYHDGRLVYFDHKAGHWGVLQALGYECVRGEEVPTHQIPPELDKDPKTGYWAPPREPATLEAQQAAVRERLRREKVAYYEAELARLRAEGS